MDKRCVDQELEKLCRQLLVAHGPQRENLLHKISQYTTDAEVDCVHHWMTTRRDLAAIGLLLDYLVSIETRAAWNHILKLAGDENPEVRFEACATVGRVVPSAQGELWLRLLESPYRDCQKEAVCGVARLKVSRAFLALKTLLLRQPEEEVQLEVLKAFWALRDVRSITTLIDLARRTRGPVQEEALVLLGRFSSRLKVNPLAKLLDTEDDSTRNMTYQVLLRLRAKSADKFIAAGLVKETSRKIKINILTALRSVRTRQIFDAVIHLATEDPSSTVRMMALSVLERVRSAALCGWIFSSEKKSGPKMEPIFLRLLGGYVERPSVCRFLKSVYLRSMHPELRLAAIEALGRPQTPQVKSFLTAMIRQRPQEGLTLATILTPILDSGDFKRVTDLLSLDPAVYSTSLAVLLAWLSNAIVRTESAALPEKRLRELAGDADPLVSYFALQCLAISARKPTILLLIFRLWRTRSRACRFAAEKAIERFIRNRPSRFADLVRIGFKRRDCFGLLVRFSKALEMDTAEEERALRAVLAQAEKQGVLEASIKASWTRARLLLLVKYRIEFAKSRFFYLLEQASFQDKETAFLLCALNHTNLYRLQGLATDFLTTVLYEKSSDTVKREILKFLSRLAAPSARVQNLLFRELASPTTGPLRAFAESVMREKLYET